VSRAERDSRVSLEEKARWCVEGGIVGVKWMSGVNVGEVDGGGDWRYKGGMMVAGGSMAIFRCFAGAV
jgi:hypothetical protein